MSLIRQTACRSEPVHEIDRYTFESQNRGDQQYTAEPIDESADGMLLSENIWP
jgi:hypothetical protein